MWDYWYWRFIVIQSMFVEMNEKEIQEIWKQI